MISRNTKIFQWNNVMFFTELFVLATAPAVFPARAALYLNE